MNQRAAWLVAAVGLGVVFMAAGVPPAYAGCVPWKTAGRVISENGLVPGQTVFRKAKSKGGDVISMKLCENGGKFVYKITVLGKKGNVRNLKVDARTGRF